MALRIPVSKAPELYGFSVMDTKELTLDQQAILNVLEVPRGDADGRITFLQTRLEFPALQVSDKETPLLRAIQKIEDFHPSWTVYKVAAEFSLDPSKEKLASALKTIAPLLSEGIDTRQVRWQMALPWPILACTGMCTDACQLEELADKAADGQLGDVLDWVAAENRWTERGITLEDILSMTDDRMPFESGIASSGFSSYH